MTTNLRRHSRAAAIHEAAHAVARVHVGAQAMAVELRGRSGGFAYGTGEVWACSWTGQHAAWSYLIVLLSGGYAEARASKRSATIVFLTSASDDMAEAMPSIDWLVQRGFADDHDSAWRRAGEETRAFLSDRWADIARVADGLQRGSRLEASEVIALTNPIQQRTTQ